MTIFQVSKMLLSILVEFNRNTLKREELGNFFI
jgi:hypothetical protein